MLGLAFCGLYILNEIVHFMISLTHINLYSFDLLCIKFLKLAKTVRLTGMVSCTNRKPVLAIVFFVTFFVNII
jgi:hypothetical protein